MLPDTVGPDASVPGSPAVRAHPGTPGPDWCSMLSGAEPLAGTAAHQPAWVLLEHPHGWGRDVLDGEAFGPELSTALERHLKDCEVRLLLIRHPGRTGQVGGPRRLYLCDTRPGGSGVRASTVGDPAELLGLDLRAGAAVPGAREGGRRWSVCVESRPVAPRPASCGAAPEPGSSWHAVEVVPGD